MSLKSVNRSNFFLNVLPKIGVLVNLMSIFFVIYYVLSFGFIIATVESGRNLEKIEGDLFSPKYLLFGSLFLYPLVGYLKSKNERVVYNLTIFLFIFFSLAMSSRGTTVIGIIVFIMTYLHNKGLRLNVKLIFNKKFIGYFLFFIVGIAILYQIPSITSATDYLIYRFTQEESLGESRTEEAVEIYNHLSFNEFFFGRGLGAANTYWIFSDVPNGVNNVHYGWMFLILKGGLLFVLFIYGKIIHSVVKLYKNKELAPYGITLIAFLLLEYSHTNFNSYYKLIFMFIALSAADLIKKKYEY